MVKNNIKHFKKAFSLAEILLSVTIVAIILLLAMPAITKKSLDNIIKRGGDSAEFYFNDANNDNSVLPCYVTTLAADNTTTNVTDNTGECQVYDFTIPKGVHKIDLTLVAGGGGGGGAGGGRIVTKTITKTDPSFTFNRTRLKSATVNILTGAGTEGETSNQRKGGNSGTAVIDFTLPNDFIYKNESVDMVYGDYNVAVPSSREAVQATLDIEKTDSGYVDTNSTPITVDFKGTGIKFTSKMEDNTSDYTSLFFLSDAVSGANPSASSKVLCATNITDPTVAIADQLLNANIISVSGKQDLSSSDNIVTQSCKLNPASYKASVEGQLPVGLPTSSETITSGKINMGGKGGNNGSYWYEKGKGGDGASLIYNCFKTDGSSAATTCKWSAASGYSSSTYADSTMGGESYGEIFFEIENPPSTGAGGVGGSAVKIKDFVVRPGKTYKIVVGKGGAGGSAGTTSTSPSTGSQGTGGSTTAIFDDVNKLVLMVAGGVGGRGGRISNTSSFTQTINLLAPISTRSVPLVIIGNDYDGKLTVDDEVASVSAIITGDKVVNDMANTTAYRLVYGYMRNMIQPLFALSTKLNSFLIRPSTYNFDTYNNASSGERKMGGFSAFATGQLSNLSSNNYKNIFLDGTYSYKGENITLPYTGFYFRYPISGTYYYAGGLGGFSGIGGKAGCGGGFVGNYYGYRFDITDATIKINNKLANTMAMLRHEGSSDVAKIFNINEYFDGCTTSTTDGHSAEFVAPVISNGKIENYGSAGAGGGGGGYNIKLGSGNGADGQNGYVVITWKK